VEIGKRVLALDFSEGMIRQAQQKIRAPNVTFQVADLTQPWPVPPESIDWIACDLVMEHVADLKFIFAQAYAVLKPGGRFFVSELHPLRQYRGSKAIFQHEGQATEIDAFVHHLSDYLNAAESTGYSQPLIKEWWHPEDQGKEPRLVSFLCEK
jgi:malonyl-CoA O-methyltransferase